MYVAIELHQDSETYRDFCGGNHHDEEDKNLSIRLIPHFGKGHQCEIRGIQHQLNAHKHDDGIATPQHAESSKTKQHP